MAKTGEEQSQGNATEVWSDRDLWGTVDQGEKKGVLPLASL